jgi:hypothetical protein
MLSNDRNPESDDEYGDEYGRREEYGPHRAPTPAVGRMTKRGCNVTGISGNTSWREMLP